MRTCLESVSGHDDGGTIDGTCTWCGKRLESVGKLRPARYPVSELTDWYGIYYDPDYGVRK